MVFLTLVLFVLFLPFRSRPGQRTSDSATSLEGDIMTAHLHHRASRSSSLAGACSSHHFALLPLIRHQNYIACICFMHFFLTFLLCWGVSKCSPLWSPWHQLLRKKRKDHSSHGAYSSSINKAFTPKRVSGCKQHSSNVVNVFLFYLKA